MVSLTLPTNTYSSIIQYIENGGYVAGSKVKNAGKQYECKAYPYSGWCNGAAWAYGPGTGSYWQDAWIEKGSCNAKIGMMDANTISSNENVLLLTPNPASYTVSFSNNETIIFKVVNALGVEVTPTTEIEPNGSFSIQHFPTGVYYFQIQKGFEHSTQRLIKQ